MATLLFVGAANAQDKEALKAQKAAQKEAEALVKKAKQTYETSIANPQYGRKETDFAKLEPAVSLIEQALTNEYTKNDMQTWKTAADIQAQYYTKYENEAKADESARPKFIETASKLVDYCVKYDDLLAANDKAKEEEKKLYHTQYQNLAVNPCIQLLQAAQNYSNSDDKNDLVLGAKYADQFLNTMEKTHLMSDFSNDNLEDWKTYAKAFRAQSYYNIPGTPEEKVVEVYTDLMSTKYKSIAYQSLANYYREKDQAKQNLYLQKGVDDLKGNEEAKDLRANFAIILMQNQFQAKDYDNFLKTAAIIKEEMSDNENAINAYLMEGQMLFENQKYTDAEKVFLDARAKYPDEPKGLLMAARCAWMNAQVNGSKKADMDHAIQLFKDLEKENPEDPELWGESLYILYNNTQQAALAAPYKKYYKPM